MNEYKSALESIADEVKVVDLRDQALATSRRIGMRRNATFAVAGLLAISLAATAFLTEDPGQVQPGASPTASSWAVVPVPTDLPGPLHGEDTRLNFGPFPGRYMTVPSFGPGTDAVCVSGRIKMGENGQYLPGSGRKPVNILNEVESDVDRDGKVDFVAYLSCGEGPEASGRQVVAFKRSGQEFLPIGRVAGSQDGFRMMDAMEALPDGRVKVWVAEQYSDGGQQFVPNQWRTYAWEGDRFRQVSGPTTFSGAQLAINLAVDPARIELRFRRVQNVYVGTINLKVRNTGTAKLAKARFIIDLPEHTRPTGDAWSGCTFEAAAPATHLVCPIAAISVGESAEFEFEVLSTAKMDNPEGSAPVGLLIEQLPPYSFQTGDWAIPIEITYE